MMGHNVNVAIKCFYANQSLMLFNVRFSCLFNFHVNTQYIYTRTIFNFVAFSFSILQPNWNTTSFHSSSPVRCIILQTLKIIIHCANANFQNINRQAYYTIQVNSRLYQLAWDFMFIIMLVFVFCVGKEIFTHLCFSNIFRESNSRVMFVC